MLDPVTAIGLATNVAELVELSWKIVSKSRDICKHGALPEHRDMKTVTTDLQNVNNKLLGLLHQAEKDQGLTDNDEALRQLCESSNKIATQLTGRLKSIDPGDECPSWKSIRHALKSVWIKSELDDTSARLQAYRSQLNTRILVSLHKKIDRLDGNTQNIATSIGQNRALMNDNQEIQMQYLTKLIISQHESTRRLFHAIVTVNPSFRLSATPLVDAALRSKEQDYHSAVFEAVTERDNMIPKLRGILRDDPSAIFASNTTGQTALHLAASTGDADLVGYLIRNGSRINPDDDEGRTPLHNGAQSGSYGVVRALLAGGGDPLAKDAQGHTPRDLCDPSSLLNWPLTYGVNLEFKNEKGYTAIFHFTEQGDYSAVQTLLDQNADIETIGRRNRTPLLEAAEQGNVEIVQLLLSRGASVHKRDVRNGTPLLVAGYYGYTRLGELFLDYGADINAANECNFTALHECCGHGHIEMGLMLIRRGARTDQHHFSGWPPLHQAAGHGHWTLVEAILDHGGDIDILNPRTHYTALVYACEYGRVDTVELLLTRGANADIRIGDDDITVLMRAAKEGMTSVVEVMLDHSDMVDIESSDKEGRTAFFWAVLGGRIDTVRTLLDRGANPEARDGSKSTALCRACQNNDLKIAELLVHKGANVHAFNDGFWTPLHEVSARGYVAIAEILIGHHADPNSRNHQRYTSLNLAAQSRHLATVRVLLDSGRAEVDAQNQDGWTSLAEAAHHGQPEIARSLLKYSASVNIPDNDKWTPLLRAVQSGHLSVVTLLLDEGNADINVVNDVGFGALAEACWQGRVDILKALLVRGARRDVRTNNGDSLRDIALMR
ncbi:MAG: Ankyrin-2 [Bathelium mastoideum]|nr:MAG: Ankyrin-2 [Bathelium mastoideum]